MEPIVRVSISNDCEWETQFIPWLEEKEKNNVGVEDGVFVATVDPALRHLQPGEEDNFLTYCIDKKLTQVSSLRLRQYIQEGIYEFQCKNYDVDSFKTYLSNLDSFKTNNCCTPFLEQDDGYLSNLFNHLHSELNRIISFAESRDKSGSSRSKVLVEESACEMEQLYNKHRQNTDSFSWGKKQKKDVEYCPDMECLMFPPETSKKGKSSQIYENIGELICYGYGFEKSGDSLQITPKLNMSRIFNLLWLLPRQYPGLHSSYLYFGDSHAFFPVHLEDALTLSLNFLHIGKPKGLHTTMGDRSIGVSPSQVYASPFSNRMLQCFGT
ncbi:hypothetical protein FOCC_FOCC013694 [Frankliniella occidentalis]|nr:hypothetical protein FOCC_FOCC013694 [Frankliniella occidentalis]